MTEPTSGDVAAIVSAALRDGKIVLPNGESRAITHNVTLPEALQLAATVQRLGCRSTAETGMAYGISSLAICAALRSLGTDVASHVAIDPNQSSEYGGAALALLRQYGLEKYCRLMEGPAHIEAPKLISEGVSLDFAFIDGWHTFDYTFIDFFLMDKLLRPGGVMAFHDSYGIPKRRVVSFILSHRKYRLLPYQKVPAFRAAKEIAASIKRGKPKLRPYADRRPSLIFLEKLETWEPNYDFYKHF